MITGGLAVRNRYHKPNSDGCGSLGVSVSFVFNEFPQTSHWSISMQINEEYLPVAEMTDCCNEHDLCYDTCNAGKEKCDFDFKRCLYKICESHEHMGAPFVKGQFTTSLSLFF